MGQCHVNHGRVVVLELSWAGLDSNGKDAEDLALSSDHWILGQAPLCLSTGADYPGRVQASPEDVSVLFPCCAYTKTRTRLAVETKGDTHLHCP
jgi:hypothetical protein